MIPQHFAYLILPIFIYSVWDYIVLILKDKVSPKIVSWGLWSFSNLTAFIVAIYKNQQFMDLFGLFAASVCCGTVAIFGLTRKNKSLEIGKLDWVCIALTLIGILVSLVTTNLFWALIFAMIADVSACVPTFINAFVNPEKEGLTNFSLAMLCKIIGFLVIKDYNFYRNCLQLTQ